MGIEGNWDRRRMSRRSFLGSASMGAGAIALAASGVSARPTWAAPWFAGDPFALGVASGDPLPHGVVLWTRIAPDPVAEDGRGGMPDRKVPVRFEVARDEAFRDVVRRGRTFATPELAHSVHVEVDGLEPGRDYFYRFMTGPEVSPVGRTRTAPAPGAMTPLAFAMASCQNYPAGHFTAYRHMAEEDLDLVVHLGDFIYQGPSQGSIGRPHLPAREAVTLTDYRIRHGQYRSDPDLRAAHGRHPFLVTWDDHEVTNNYADEDGESPSGVPFLERRADAYQAYYEHQPLRLASRPQGSDLRLYRRLAFGGLVELSLLDTRQYRDPIAHCTGDDERDCAERVDPERTLLGAEQERWLLDGLARSGARWNVLAQQVVFSQLDFRAGPEDNVNTDAWDGYPAARRRIVELLAAGGADNPVVLTGDVHKNYVFDVKEDFEDDASPVLGTEFVTTSISSGGDGADTTAALRNQLANNPHLKHADDRRGYVRCTVDGERWRADLRQVPFVRAPGAPIRTSASFEVDAGSPGARAV